MQELHLNGNREAPFAINFLLSIHGHLVSLPHPFPRGCSQTIDRDGPGNQIRHSSRRFSLPNRLQPCSNVRFDLNFGHSPSGYRHEESLSSRSRHKAFSPGTKARSLFGAPRFGPDESNLPTCSDMWESVPFRCAQYKSPTATLQLGRSGCGLPTDRDVGKASVMDWAGLARLDWLGWVGLCCESGYTELD